MASTLPELLQFALLEVSKGRIPSQDIIKALISKGLGYGILAGSMLVKVPQVLNVVRASSAEGLSPLAFELETLGLVIAVTYGFLMHLPFSAFGETVALLLQNNSLLVLIYYYQRCSLARSLIMLALLAGSGFVALSGMLTQAHISALYDMNNLILIASRVPQIVKNFALRSTGRLSVITYGLNTAGAAARVFTSIQEAAGPAMMRGAIISALLNLIILLQILAFGGKKTQRRRGRQRTA